MGLQREKLIEMEKLRINLSLKTKLMIFITGYVSGIRGGSFS